MTTRAGFTFSGGLCEPHPAKPDAAAAVLATEAVRRSRDGDWDALAKKAEAIQAVVDGIGEARLALGAIERKARDSGVAVDKHNAYVIGLVAELAAMVRGR